MIGRASIFAGAILATVLLAGEAGAVEAQTLPSSPPAMSLPPPGVVDEALFREGLRARGLSDWLKQYAVDSQPADDVDAALRKRESLLAKLDDPMLSLFEREAIVRQASELLAAQIEKRPGELSSLWWRFDLARDYMERANPDAFEAILRFDLPGRDRTVVAALSTKALDVLNGLRDCIAATWDRVEGLDEADLAMREASGWLRGLESLDYRSTVLLAWAELYRAISTDISAEQRTANLNQLLAAVKQRAWTDNAKHDAAQRANILVLAAVAARYAGRLEEAAEYARQIVAVQSELGNAARRKQLRDEVLLSVVEQVRVLRDAGKRDEALQAVDAARGWVRKARPDDPVAALAIDLTEWSILAGRPSGGGVLASAEALVPLEAFASQSLPHREAVYAALAGSLAGEHVGPGLAPFALQLLVGAVVEDVATRLPAEKRASDERLASVMVVLEQAAASQPADLPAAQAGELAYLRGRALYLMGRRLDTVAALSDLVARWPEHDRAEIALRQAVSMAQESLGADGVDQSKARAAFVRAGRMFRKRFPDVPVSKRLQYFIAQALEDDGRLREAATEYAAIPSDDPNAARGALRRARCMRAILQSAIDETKRSPDEVSLLADEAVRAASEGVDAAATRPAGSTEADVCLAAEQVLVLANILNCRQVGRPDETVRVLDGFESRFARCPAAIGQALRERIVALRQLKRMSEARQVVEEYLKAEPEQAGPVMIRLLEAMHAEIDIADERGDQQTVREVAGEAAELARSLMEWSEARPNRIPPPDRLTIAIWRAGAILHAGRPDESADLFDACAELMANMPGDHRSQDIEIRLGKAESLLSAGKADAAMPIFALLGKELPEESPRWWRAFAGQLQCHTALSHNPTDILQAIQQRRYFSPDLGGPRVRRMLEAVEKTNRARLPASTPSP